MEKSVDIISRTFNGTRRKAAANASLNISKKQSSNFKRVTSLLRKRRAHKLLTEEESRFLVTNSELVKQFYERREKRAECLRRLNEHEDSPKELKDKCFKLAQAIHDAEFLVVYTGAGISTAASIPDYRGPNGIWTRLQKGKDIGTHDLTTAEPTLTHMALSCLHSKGIVRHVISQNCDGLHLRSGLPKTSISELHGNMYIEVCKHCVPAREYVRTFDVTEKTSTFKHTTGRRCYRCGEPLVDTIVHFGERGRLRWPLNWQGACQAAKACDTILCLGSSLKVLRKYPWLWQMDRPPKRRPHLYIVNLQWTPKDKDATMKINGKCDEVMRLVMENLGFEVPDYIRAEDPIFQISTALHADEVTTTNRLVIEPPPPPPSSPHSISPQGNLVHKNSAVGADHALRVITNSFLEVGDNSEVRLNKVVINSKSKVLSSLSLTGQGNEWSVLKDELKEECDPEEVKSEAFAVKKEEALKSEESKPEFGYHLKVKEVKQEFKHETKEETTDYCCERRGHSAAEIDLQTSAAYLSDSETDASRAKVDSSVTRNGLSPRLFSSFTSSQCRLGDFYGTGLCIRSTSTALDEVSNEDDDDDDTSISSMTSDSKYETTSEMAKRNWPPTESNVDFLFVSDDSLDTNISRMESNLFCHSGEGNVITSRANDSRSFSFSDAPDLSIKCYNNEDVEIVFGKENLSFGGSNEDSSTLVEEVSINGNVEAADVELPVHKEEGTPNLFSSDLAIPNATDIEVPFSVLFSDSNLIQYQKNGRYLLHTKIIDGIIQAADVKSLSDANEDEEPINGMSNNFSSRPYPNVDSQQSELKALWYKKFCGNLTGGGGDVQKSPVEDTVPPSVELDDDVKRLWFWGFDTRPKEKQEEEDEEPHRRLTRSRVQKSVSQSSSSSSSSSSAKERECRCCTANPELCHLSSPRPDALPLEPDMARAREAVQKRRQHNYKRFEPVFKVTLKSLTYERRRRRRKSKREELEEDCEEGKKDVMEREEGIEEIKKNGEVKVVPGWYGKGYKKILKKKRHSL